MLKQLNGLINWFQILLLVIALAMQSCLVAASRDAGPHGANRGNSNRGNSNRGGSSGSRGNSGGGGGVGLGGGGGRLAWVNLWMFYVCPISPLNKKYKTIIFLFSNIIVYVIRKKWQ